MLRRVSCDKCGEYFNAFIEDIDLEDERLCSNCEQNAAEAAYERLIEDFHDGGSTRFKSLAEQAAEARKLK